MSPTELNGFILIRPVALAYTVRVYCLCISLRPLISKVESNVGLGTEFRSEKIPRNRLGTISVIPRKKKLIPRHSEFRGRANSEARNGTKRNGIPRKK
jgi:hypothetical protein